MSPSNAHSTLGVMLDVSGDVANIAPTPHWRKKLEALVRRFFSAGTCRPTEAGSLAGKAAFLDLTCFGRDGRAATKPLYARQHMNAKVSAALTHTLRAILSTFGHLARVAPPRSLHMSSDWQPVPFALR